MSQATVLALVERCVRDDVVGLAAQIMRVAIALSGDPTMGINPAVIRQDFRFVKARLPGTAHLPTNAPNVLVRPVEWVADGRQANLRDGTMLLEIAVEYFDGDEAVLEANRRCCGDAIALMLDELRDFSDLHNGPVIDVLWPVPIRTGDFEGPASSGLLATVQLQERSVL